MLQISPHAGNYKHKASPSSTDLNGPLATLPINRKNPITAYINAGPLIDSLAEKLRF